jgi:hypothetical protein
MSYQSAKAAIARYEEPFSQYDFMEKNFLFSILRTALPQIYEANARVSTRLHGMISLVALRHWQLTHSEPADDLAKVMSDVGLDTVPLDIFSDVPLKLTRVRGTPVIYSVGPDCRDDNALIEWIPGENNDAGDLLFKLEPVVK